MGVTQKSSALTIPHFCASKRQDFVIDLIEYIFFRRVLWRRHRKATHWPRLIPEPGELSKQQNGSFFLPQNSTYKLVTACPYKC
jgi:hypothetical protein